MTQRIVIAGYYGYRNAGDEAILAGMLADLRAEIPAATFTIFSGDPEETRALHGVDAVSWDALDAQVEAIRESSLVIVGGGGLFHDYWGVEPATVLTSQHAGITQYAGPIVLARLLGKPCMLYAVGAGPLQSEESRGLTREIVSLADIVTVRDPGSKQLLEEIGCDGNAVQVTADPAFSLDTGSLSAAARACLDALRRPILGVSVRPWSIGVDPGEWEAAVAAGLDGVLETEGGTALFVPMQAGTSDWEDDAQTSRRVMSRMSRTSQASLYPASAGPLDRFTLLAHCDLVLGMRLHSLIAAAKGHRRVVGLAYDPKITEVFRLLNQEGDAVSLHGLDSNEIRARLSKAARSIEGGPKGRGRERTGALERRAKDSSRLAARLLGRGARPSLEGDGLVRQVVLKGLADAHRYRLDLSNAHERIQGVSKALGQAQEALEHAEKARAQRDALLAERNRLESELLSLRSTLGVRLLNVYWMILHKVFPDGSRAREALAYVNKLVRGAARIVAPGLWPAYYVRPSGPRIRGPEELQPSPGLGNRVRSTSDAFADLLRFEEDVDLRGSRRLVAVFSTTQLIESEGQRSTNLALECAKRGLPVVFVAWRWNLGLPTNQDRLEQGILQIPIDQILHDPGMLFGSFQGRERIVLFEFPHPQFYELMAAANGEGWTTIYEAIDDWEGFHQAGQAKWWLPGSETALAASADLVTAVNSVLAAELRAKGRDQVLIVPNGVVPGIELSREDRDLPKGAVTVGYWGHLTEAWFDWPLLLATAAAEPTWRFLIAGYGDGARSRDLPANVTLLGKQPQSSLAAIGRNIDVGIVPFKRGRVSQKADVIKIYEYLAMGLPVVATGVEGPDGAADFILRAKTPSEFRALIAQGASQKGRDAEARRAFAAGCTWGARLDALVRAIDTGDQGVGLKRSLFGALP